MALTLGRKILFKSIDHGRRNIRRFDGDVVCMGKKLSCDDSGSAGIIKNDFAVQGVRHEVQGEDVFCDKFSDTTRSGFIVSGRIGRLPVVADRRFILSHFMKFVPLNV